MSKLKKINISEIDGNENSIFPAGTVWIDLQGRLRVSDGVTENGQPLTIGIEGTVYPSAGSGTAGVVFPNDPGGGSGDTASIKYYATSGEAMRLHIDVQNDIDDEILISASGPITIQPNENGFLFDTDGALTFSDNAKIKDGFIQHNDSNGVVGLQSNDGLSVFDVSNLYGARIRRWSAGPTNEKDWTFNADGTFTFPDGTDQTTAWTGGRVVAVPAQSTGASGDKAGDIAFDSNYFYYCKTDYVAASYEATLKTGYSGGNQPTLIKGSYPQPKIGWSFDWNTVTYTLVSYDATDPNPGEWFLFLDQNIDTTPGGSITLNTNLMSTDIWVRIAWSNDTW